MVNNFITSEHIPIIIFILSFPLSVTFITQMSNPSNPVTLYSQKKLSPSNIENIPNTENKYPTS